MKNMGMWHNVATGFKGHGFNYIPDANHDAGIFTSKLGHKHGVNVGIHIPAPWFAHGT